MLHALCFTLGVWCLVGQGGACVFRHNLAVTEDLNGHALSAKDDPLESSVTGRENKIACWGAGEPLIVRRNWHIGPDIVLCIR